MMVRPALITGGAGFIGCNLADALAEAGEHVLVFDNFAREGVAANAAWLKLRHPRRVSVRTADIRDPAALAEAVRDASAVFHLAAQVAVTNSLADPLEDFDVNLRGTMLLLETLRQRGGAVPLVFASTNKVYGTLAGVEFTRTASGWLPSDPALAASGVDERLPLAFHTPYGCSKGSADQYVLDYAASFGLPAIAVRMSCIYGPRQRGTEDQGWVAHFLFRAMAGEPITLYGDGYQVRDVLFVDDAVNAYVSAARRAGSLAGRAFNLGGGPDNAVSLLGLLEELERLLRRPIARRFAPCRQGDQRWFVSDTAQARSALGLPKPLGWRIGLARLAAWAGETQFPEVAA